MPDDIDPADDHLDESAISDLLSGRARPEHEAHLLLCDECRRVYEIAATSLHTETSSKSRRTVPRRRRAAAWASAVTVAAVLTVVAILPRGGEPEGFRATLPESMHEEIAQVSSRWLVFPGFENETPRERPLFRSGDEPTTSFAELVDVELQHLETGDATVDESVRAITGLILDYRLVDAWRWSERVRADNPDDTRIDFLRALVAQRSGDLERTASILGALCGDGDGDPVMCLNLLLVQAQLGDREAALATRERLERAGASAAVLRRADDVLD